MYEFDDHINENHLPLELGDIFERIDGGSAKKYILLVQPCDLMVRSDGRRQPEIYRVPLAEIVSTNEPSQYSEEMLCFDASPSKRWFVRLKSANFVRGEILDLCALNKDGVARVAVNGIAPPGLRPTWKTRHDILARYWRNAVRKADKLAPVAREHQSVGDFKRGIAKDLGGLLFDDDLFKGSVVEAEGVRSVTYNCRRVRRLSRDRAMGLLMSYAANLGRPAYDREFDK